MNSRKDRKKFEIIHTFSTDCLHARISLARKKRPRSVTPYADKYDYVWYMKRESKSDRPINEVIAQEFLRLLFPHQPKTRLMVDADGLRSFNYVISREIPGFESFSLMGLEKVKKLITSGELTGLGEVLIGALLIGENDLNSGNIGRDENNRVVKIDGGFAFKSKKDITPGDISSLPKLVTYPTNWLDLSIWRYKYRESRFNDKAVFGDPGLSTLKSFRCEIHRALLKIILLPKGLIEKFVSSYDVEDQEKQFIQCYLLLKKKELKLAALELDEFKAYLCSQQSVEDLQHYLADLKKFKTTGKHYIMQEESFEADIIRRYESFRTDVSGELFTLQVEEEPIAKRLRSR